MQHPSTIVKRMGDMTVTDCGVQQHEETCLCDVVVEEITPINYGGHELDNAELVIKYRNLGAPWSSATMASLFEGLDMAREASDMIRRHEPQSGNLSTYTGMVREMIGCGHSMADIPNMLGLSLAECAAALMSGRTTATICEWSEADWLAFEADVYDGLGSHRLARRHNVNNNTANKLIKLYRERADQR